MAGPVRFPRGLSTFAPRSVMGSYPISTSPSQIAMTEDFIPYRATDYTVTTAVAGTATSFPQMSGALKLATSASATDTIFLARNGQGFQFMPNNQMWFDMKLAYPRTVLNANDTNIYLGMFDNAVPTSATNAIYFFKPAGSTAVQLIIKKAGTTTTFQNVADLSIPSGLYGDTNSVNGTLTSVVTGGGFTGVSVATPGAGYQCSPLVLTTAASGVAGNNITTVGIGSTANTQSNPAVPVQSTALPYGSLYAPYAVTQGSGYTNTAGATTYLEVLPLIDLQFWYNGKDTLYVGVNGRQVMAISATGTYGATAGGTYNLATSGVGPSFYATNTLATSVAPVLPATGSPMHILPLTQMQIGFGMANTTANIRTLYIDEYNCAVELN